MKVNHPLILKKFVVGHFAIGGGWPGVDRRFDRRLWQRVAARPAVFLCSVFSLFICASIRAF
ncbi:hypothetical protein RchiOBHm_Chr3g0456281 [Rosa chinensis]|uniref:Uncharacterized protein n=1 Tax=Rosa chinensis TaxID=74649 RepID=A0A2P6R7C4_ROSCH|nr:hypothetical protein RchiOBHm_Chr3g0456281 [Rosa chinensis]